MLQGNFHKYFQDSILLKLSKKSKKLQNFENNIFCGNSLRNSNILLQLPHDIKYSFNPLLPPPPLTTTRVFVTKFSVTDHKYIVGSQGVDSYGVVHQSSDWGSHQ